MSFEILARQSAIGWDLDGTLFDHQNSGEPHPNQGKMFTFIKANPQIRHFIVTFRSHGWQHAVWEDLKSYPDAPPPTAFEGLLNVSDQTYEAYRMAARQHGADLSVGDVHAYLTWKGRVCAENGITILVDDMTDHVMHGCDQYGVIHIHPDDL